MTELPFQRERPDATVATPLALRELQAYGALLDARSPSEFEDDHLPGAVNVPPDEVRTLVPQLVPDRAAEIVVYCFDDG